MNGWLRAALSTLLALAATAAAAPPTAHAEPISVYSCAGPGGQPLPMAPWWQYELAPTNHEDACSTGGDAFAEFNGIVANGAEGGWQFLEPADLDMTHVRWTGGAEWNAGWNDNESSRLYSEIYASGAGTLFEQAGAIANSTRTFAVPSAAVGLVMSLECRDPADGCLARGHRLRVGQLYVRLMDDYSPTASGYGGSITTPGYKSGVVGLSAVAADRGTGVRKSHLTVDGAYAAARSHTVDKSATCEPVDPTLGGYRTAVPCALEANDSLSLDTSTLADGTYSVGYVVEDASGNRTVAKTFSLQVNHPGGAVPDTPCTDGVDNDGDGRVDYGDDVGCTRAGDDAETENPTSTSPPNVSGAAQIGASLGYSAGTWTDGPVAGGTTAIRWQACRFDGAACVDVPGRTGTALPLTDELVGRRIRVVETRTTSQGAAEQASEKTAVVKRADGTLPTCADGVDNDGDNLVDHDTDLGCSSRSDATEDWSGPAEDADGDGIPNASDPDDDGDGVPDSTDPRPLDPTNPGGSSGDWDGDGVPNGTDPDDDNDGVPDTSDPAPYNPAITGSAGSTTSSTNTTIIIERPAGSPVVAGVATNGRNASDRAVVSLIGRKVRNVPHGRKVAMVGRLVNERGQPIAGAVMTVEQRTYIPGSGPKRGASFRPVTLREPVRTDVTGRFRYLVPARHSRTVRLGYKARTADRDFTSVTELTLLVRSKAKFGVNRRNVRNGQAVRFAGRLLGGMIPRTGVQVVLQARTPRGWVTFKTARAKSRGRFSAGYRFTATTGTRTYRFRARIRPDSGYPWVPSTTRTIKVTVRG